MDILPNPSQAPHPQFPWLSVPVAILLAGVMVSGSVLFIGSGGGLAGILPSTDLGSGNAQEPKKPDVQKIAKDLKLDMTSFNQCIADGTPNAKIDRDMAAASQSGITGTPSFFINGQFIVGAQPLSTFTAAIDKALANPNGKWDTSLVADGAVMGSPTAPVTMIEFSDFECPYCARFFKETLPAIQEQYIDTGKVRLVYRHYPLVQIHPNARPYAVAAECAGAQNKFWEFHDALFGN